MATRAEMVQRFDVDQTQMLHAKNDSIDYHQSSDVVHLGLYA